MHNINNKSIPTIFTDGTTNTTIEDSDLNFSIDNIVTLKCLSDGNPNPNYTWKFNHTDISSNAKYNISVDKTELSFTITNISDSGFYQCVTSNNVSGKLFKSSSNVTLKVQEQIKDEHLLEGEQQCLENSCLFLQSCISRNGSAVCSVNIWAVISIVFIILTLILGTTSVSLFFLRIIHRRKTICKNGINIG